MPRRLTRLRRTLPLAPRMPRMPRCRPAARSRAGRHRARRSRGRCDCEAAPPRRDGPPAPLFASAARRPSVGGSQGAVTRKVSPLGLSAAMLAGCTGSRESWRPASRMKFSPAVLDLLAQPGPVDYGHAPCSCRLPRSPAVTVRAWVAASRPSSKPRTSAVIAAWPVTSSNRRLMPPCIGAERLRQHPC